MSEIAMSPSILEWYDKYTGDVRALIHGLWSHPELSLEEHYAAELVSGFCRSHGFTDVETRAAEDFHNPDAAANTVIARWGSGKPVICIMGELDALPGLGNEAVPYRAPIEGPGHGCGHCLMGGGAAGAACALRYAMEKEGLPGTVMLVDAPAEEIGAGKAYLAKEGVFNGVDLAMMWHDGPGDLDFAPRVDLSIFNATFEFYGKSAHASGNPWDGHSALDALQLMAMGTEFMREHMPPKTSMHYCIESGGAAPNVVPDYARIHYNFRAEQSYDKAKHLYERACEIAQGAAVMTQTTVKPTILSVMPQMHENLTLCGHLAQAAEKVPPLRYNEEEYAFAREIWKNLTGKDAPEEDSKVLGTGLVPFQNRVMDDHQSATDTHCVSYFCPTAHIECLGQSPAAMAHTWAFTATAGTGIGEKAGVYAYECIAQGAYEALKDPEIIRACWDEFKSKNIPPYQHWSEMN